MLKYYVCRYYLNANHSFNNIQKNAHQHTFTFAVSMESQRQNDMVPFHEIDHIINHYLTQYKGKYLNSLPQFQGLYPSIEWIGELFYEDLYILLDEKGWNCLQLEVSENPLKAFLVSDRIMLVSSYPGDNQRTWDKIIKSRNRYVVLLDKVKEKA